MHKARRNRKSVPIACAALCATLALPACASTSIQEVERTITRALAILDELDRLLERILARQAANSRSATNGIVPGGWIELFDGRSLTGWKVTEFAGGGDVNVDRAFRGGPPAIVVKSGVMLSGFNYTREVPKTNYEISLETMKIDGNDFICGLTFPVGDSHASLILGGWGGGVVGISSIDDRDASENETTKFMAFPKNRWYSVRMRVTPAKLEAWLDDKKIVDQDITNRKISLRRGEISRSIPLGISTFQTSAAFRAIKLRRFDMKSSATSKALSP